MCVQSVQRRTGQPQFKSLDAVLQSYNKTTNEKQALTYKCADINTAVPALMGVNKVGEGVGSGGGGLGWMGYCGVRWG